ncbi:MAG: ATP-dependent Clp protease ATP-binding subunit, partial [Vagococcus sp.]
MLCQNCQSNEATIHLYTQVQGQKKQVDLCQQCYRQIKQQEDLAHRERMTQDPFGFGSLNDLFRQLQEQNKQQPTSNNQIPPTEAGRMG